MKRRYHRSLKRFWRGNWQVTMTRLTRSWWKKLLGRIVSFWMILMMKSLSPIWMKCVTRMKILLNCVMQRRLSWRERWGMSNVHCAYAMVVDFKSQLCLYHVGMLKNSIWASRIVKCTCLSNNQSYTLSYVAEKFFCVYFPFSSFRTVISTKLLLWCVILLWSSLERCASWCSYLWLIIISC